MVKKYSNETPHFPYTYGDLIENDETRFSNRIIDLIQDKGFQNYAAAIVYVVYYIGSQAVPVGAIPPEVGEGVANVAAQAEIGTSGVAGDIQGTLGLDIDAATTNNKVNEMKAVPALPGNGPNSNGPGQCVVKGSEMSYGGYGNFQAPLPGAGKGFPGLIPGPPTTAFWKNVNSAAVGIGMVAICLNGAWGNPFAAVVCAGALFEAAKGLVSIARK
jgi:hypothetical protein